MNNNERLRYVSRTFAWSIRLLPGSLREPVEVAYLLARAGDTLADSGAAHWASRRTALETLRASLPREVGEGPGDDLLDEAGRVAQRLPRDRVGEAEGALLQDLPRLFDRLQRLGREDRDDVRRVLTELLTTMTDELTWFEGASAAHPRTLLDEGALERYTQGIAGCVGHFWTALVVRHRAPSWAPRMMSLSRLGQRYGRGLQLINVLRDLPFDLERGRVFVPETRWRAHRLTPADLRDPDKAIAVAELLDPLLARAREQLLAGLLYTALLPAGEWRLRVATLLPATIGWPTLEALERDPLRIAERRKVRLTRAALHRALLEALWSALRREGPRRLARRYSISRPQRSTPVTE